MKVNICVLLDGWILERLARRLEVLPYVKVTDTPQYDQINYYMSYALLNDNTPKDICFFSHYEPNHPSLTDRWKACAKRCDVGVVMEGKYKDILLKDGCRQVEIIAPGVDTTHFHPRFVVGIAGRAAENPQRKGLDVINRLKALLPFIDFRLTGKGEGVSWYTDIKDFYSQLDVYVAPERYGTSECIVEALACGIPVIAKDFIEYGDQPIPHISYTSTESLADAIKKLYKEKMDRWEFANTYANINTWITKHDQLFKSLGGI